MSTPTRSSKPDSGISIKFGPAVKVRRKPASTARLTRHYGLRDEQGIADFAQKFPTLIQTLMKVPEAIAPYFPDAKLFLDVYRDHQDPSYSLLAVRVQTKIEYPEYRARLLRFEDEWWDSHVSQELDAVTSVGIEPI